MPRIPSRRNLIKHSGLAAAGVALGLPELTAKAPADRISIGIIGTGSRGSYLGALLNDVPQATVVACCDPLPDNLKNGLAQAEGAKGYADHRKLLDDKSIDAVLVAVPQYLHFPIAIDALNAGKHVYCEKTLTQTVEETRKLVARVKAAPRQIFQVGFQERTNPLHHKIKELIRNGTAGEIEHVTAQYSYHTDEQKLDGTEANRQANWRMYRELCGGPLAELSAHQIDIVNFILDVCPVECTGMGKNFFHDGRTNYDQTHVVYRYNTGLMGTFTCLLTTAFMGYNIRLHGRKATIEIWNVDGNLADIFFEPMSQGSPPSGDVDAVSAPTKKIFSRADPIRIQAPGQPQWDTETSTIALRSFAECVLHNRQPVSTVESGAISANAVHMGNAAMRNRRMEVWDKGFQIQGS